MIKHQGLNCSQCFHFHARVQFFRDSFHAFNDRRKIQENITTFKNMKVNLISFEKNIHVPLLLFWQKRPNLQAWRSFQSSVSTHADDVWNMSTHKNIKKIVSLNMFIKFSQKKKISFDQCKRSKSLFHSHLVKKIQLTADGELFCGDPRRVCPHSDHTFVGDTLLIKISSDTS